MGIDWYPFKPKCDAKLSQIRELAREQAHAFQEWQSCRAQSEQFDAKGVLYSDVSSRLRAVVEFGMSTERPEFIDSWRVSTIEGCLNFPTDWRRNAFATFLPDELPDQLERWKSWIQSVRSGGKQRDQGLLYVSYTSRELHSAWMGLHEGVAIARTLTNTWAKRDTVQQLLAEIETIPEPFIIDRFEEISSITDDRHGDVILEQQIATLESEASRMQNTVRRWNRGAKKGQTGYWHLITFENFVNAASSPDLDEFFDWASCWSARGYGFFLDY